MAEGNGTAKITCPACHSEISSDGRALYKESARLSEFEALKGLAGRLKKKIQELEKTVHEKRVPKGPRAKPSKSTGEGDGVREPKGKEEEGKSGNGWGDW